jgi:hypothetical protein
MSSKSLVFLAFLLASASAQVRADILDDNLAHLVARDKLAEKRELAHERCARDVPQSAQWLKDPAISDFCLARFGSPRVDALMLGVRLSARLDKQGKKTASDAVEALLVSLEDPAVMTQR